MITPTVLLAGFVVVTLIATCLLRPVALTDPFQI